MNRIEKFRDANIISMRLTDQERATITEIIMSFDKDAWLYLFGFWVDDNRKGGDIDLLVLTDKLTFTDKLKIKARLCRLRWKMRFGYERKKLTCCATRQR